MKIYFLNTFFNQESFVHKFNYILSILKLLKKCLELNLLFVFSNQLFKALYGDFILLRSISR